MQRLPDRLTAALHYASRGWQVFPLIGKRPATAHGWKDATTDPHVIASTWAGTTLGVGIATGDSGLIVVDLDGPEALAWWDDHDDTPTAVVKTARGEHRYFHGLGRSTVSHLARGVDTRGSGGYVVAPPSQHPSGMVYEWADPAQEVAEAPEWLTEALRPRARPRTFRWDDLVAPVGALAIMVAEVRGAERGRRNEALNRAAWRGRTSGVALEVLVPSLVGAAMDVGLGWRESVRTTASGLGLPVDDVLAVLSERSSA